MNQDLFGHKDGAQTDSQRTAASRVENFNLGTDLSPAERVYVAKRLQENAENVRAEAYRNIAPRDAEVVHKKADRLLLEADRYVNCGHWGAGCYCDWCKTSYYTHRHCHSRICEKCGRIYGHTLEDKIVPQINNIMSRRRRGFLMYMVTITFQTDRFHGELPTRKHIERMYRETSTLLRLYFGKYKSKLSPSGKVVEQRRKLTAKERRKRRELRAEAKARGDDPPKFSSDPQRIYRGSGWIATLEIGKDNNNAHCHALVYGPFMPKSRLIRSWMEITGDSWNVDIRPIFGAKKATRYVLKYITKPPLTDDYDRIADYALMIKGTRRLRSGGIFYNAFKLEKEPTPDYHCPACGGHLVQDGEFDLSICGDRYNLWKELRLALKGQGSFPHRDLPEYFLPLGVTPVYMPK